MLLQDPPVSPAPKSRRLDGLKDVVWWPADESAAEARSCFSLLGLDCPPSLRPASEPGPDEQRRGAMMMMRQWKDGWEGVHLQNHDIINIRPILFVNLVLL